MIGRSLSHFEITAKLGEGGMGEVYRARDTKLGREVAIKLLPEQFTEDEERLARFEREAKLLASLNHPNIAGIYEVGETTVEDGRRLHFLAMELAEGEDLAQHLERGPMPLDDVVSVSFKIARALEAAHERGIVHRDLKPANVKLGADGTVKVLDFGLAKAWDGPREASPELTASPTLTARMTQVGVILGTAGYMSPEQARAQEADRRSDIWSFGVVVYEMLTGSRLFAADTVSDTLARVLTFDPDWEALEKRAPPRLVALLRRCLERDASLRLQAIGEARIALNAITAGDDGTPRVGETTSSTERASTWLPWAAAAVAILAALLLAFQSTHRARQDPPLLQAELNGPEGLAFNATQGIALSPDGRYVVVAAAESRLSARSTSRGSQGLSLWLRAIDSPTMRQIPGTEGASFPFWSPDSRHIGYFAAGKMKRVDLQGSPPLTLAEVQDPRGGSWSADGTIVYSPDFRGGLWRVSAGGGTPERIAELDRERGEQSLRWPWFLPDGEHVLFLAQTAEGGMGGDTSTIESLNLENLERQTVLENNSSMAYDGSSHLLFWRSGALLAQPFDTSSRQLAGEVVPLVEGVGYTQNEQALFGVSTNGLLIYQLGQRGGRASPLAWYDRDGNRLGEAGPVDDYREMNLSPDGTRVAYTKRDGIWVLDLERGTSSKLTVEEGDFAAPIWSPDGEWIAYRTHREGPAEIRRRRSSGLGDEEELWRGDVVVDLEDWSSDGEWFLISIQSAISPWDIATLSLETGEVRPLVSAQPLEIDGQLSPDDRWVAYNTDEAGQWESYMVPVGGKGRRVQLTVDGGEFPLFHPNGREVVFVREEDGFLYSVQLEIDPESGNARAGIPQPLFDVGYVSSEDRWHLLSQDGARILLREFENESQLSLHLVQNWKEILERRR